MAREFVLWMIVALPWAGALVCALVARFGISLLGPRRAGMLGYHLGLMGTALAALFCADLVRELLRPDDPRAFAHTALRELVDPVVVGALRIDLTLIGDRLAAAAAAAILLAVILARMFILGAAGQRALGLPSEAEAGSVPAREAIARTRRALRRLAGLGLVEGAALLIVLAGDLGLAAPGWLIVGLGGFAALAGRGGERRGDAATHALGLSLAADLALAGAGLALILGEIGLAHSELWAPLTGDHLYATVFAGVSVADVTATALLAAVGLRLSSLAAADNSLSEALLDAALTTIPAVYLLLRYERVLAYAPTVLALVLVLGMLVAPVAAAIALLRPRTWRQGPDPRVGLRAGAVAWLGLVAMAIGVGAWRSAALLTVAHVVGRLGLRLALLVARGTQLPPFSAAVGRVVCFAAAGLAPGLGFAALAQTATDVLTRTSVLGLWISWPAAAIVIVVSFAHAAATARIWYASLGRKPGASEAGDDDEDALDFTPLVLLVGLSAVAGVLAIGAWFDALVGPLAWLDKVLPLAGGHEAAPTGISEWARAEGAGGEVARTWVGACALLVALATGLGWAWARQRFRRAAGSELAEYAGVVERGLGLVARVVRPLALLWSGLTELAAAGLGRGLFERGPEIAAELARDLRLGLGPRLRGLSPGAGRLALLGFLTGLALVLGWLYAKPEAASPLPSEHYDFGGLEPKLIRAGGRSAPAPGPSTQGVDAGPGPAGPVAPSPTMPGPAGASPGAAGPDVSAGPRPSPTMPPGGPP